MPDNRIALRSFLLLVFCCFTAACNNTSNKVKGENQIDLLALTDRMSVVNRPAMLRYADSLYNAQKYKSPYITAGRYMAYSNYYDLHNLSVKALLYTDSAIRIIDRQDLSDSLWTRYYFAAHVKKAHTLFETGQYGQSIDAYFMIKEVAERPANKCDIGVKLYNNIGLVLFKQLKYAAARQYFTHALASLDGCAAGNPSLNDNQKKQELLGNIGESFANENKLDSALLYYHRALKVIEKGRFSADPGQEKILRATARGVVVSDIARIFVKENKLDSAELYFKEDISVNAIAYKNEVRNAQHSELGLAGVYNLEKNYPKMKIALGTLRKSLDSLHNMDVELGWRKLKAEYDSKIGLSASVLTDYQSYLSLKDSLEQAKASASQSDIDRELSVKKQQMDNVVLAKDNQLSHLYLWITVSLSAMTLVIIALIYYYYRRGKKNIQTLTMLNSEIGEQKDKLEFAIVELEKSNTDKERILRVVAHDLRDPIGGAATLINTVINEDMPDECEKQNLAIVEKTLANSLVLINELVELDLGKEHIPLNKEWVDINEMVKQCIDLMQLIASKKSQKLQFLGLSKPLNVHLDNDKIKRMLNNLIGNAIKFSPAGETIRIELVQKDKTVIITVKDNGIGIPPEMRTEVFNTLGNTRRIGTAGEKSFGLGLSICRQIVEAHDGRIWVESAPGSGSIFFAELPLRNNI